MAKRHIVQYFCEVENQYLEMLDNLNELKEMVAENKLSQEDFLNATTEISKLKDNYERIAYIIFLLNKPNKKTKEDIDINKKWYKVLKTSSKEAIIDENKDVLSYMKELLRKGDKLDK